MATEMKIKDGGNGDAIWLSKEEMMWWMNGSCQLMLRGTQLKFNKWSWNNGDSALMSLYYDDNHAGATSNKKIIKHVLSMSEPA